MCKCPFQFNVSQIESNLFEVNVYVSTIMELPTNYLECYTARRFYIHKIITYNKYKYQYIRVYENGEPKFYLSRVSIGPIVDHVKPDPIYSFIIKIFMFIWVFTFIYQIYTRCITK